MSEPQEDDLDALPEGELAHLMLTRVAFPAGRVSEHSIGQRSTRSSAPQRLLRQGVVDVYRRQNRDWLTVQQRWFIDPLLDGIHSRLNQLLGAARNRHLRNMPLFIDCDLQSNDALNSIPLRGFRINRRY